MEWGLKRIASRELSEWQAFNELEPIGGRRGDLQAGIVAAAVANAWTKRRDRQPFTALDFMPEFDGPAAGRGRVEVDRMEPEQRVAWLEMLNAFYGGKDLRTSVLRPSPQPSPRGRGGKSEDGDDW